MNPPNKEWNIKYQRPKAIIPNLKEIKMDRDTCRSYILVQADLHQRLGSLYNMRKGCTGDRLKENTKSCDLVEMFIDYNNKIISTHKCIRKLSNY